MNISQPIQVINIATRRVTRAMNKIMKASANHDISSQTIECSVRKALTRTEFVKDVTDKIMDNARNVSVDTQTSRRNTDRMRKITDFIQVHESSFYSPVPFDQAVYLLFYSSPTPNYVLNCIVQESQ